MKQLLFRFAFGLVLALVSGVSAQEIPDEATAQTIFIWRGLPEPLVPSAGDDAEERTRLIQALNRFAARSEPDDFSALEGFLNEHPDSPWRVAVATNLGLFQYRTGYFSRCIDSYKKAWDMGKELTEPKVRALADLAGGEYVKMLSRLGRMEEIRAFLAEVKDRTFEGPATERVSAARQGLALMEERPEMAFRCGPLAVASILSSQGKPELASQTLELESTVKGTSLAQVAALARKMGLDYQVARRAPEATVITPSVIHWKVGHYAALLDTEAGRYHSKDPTFENDTWHTARCLDEQASGYFLVPAGPLPRGWEAVGEAEAAQVFGKGATNGTDENRTGPEDHKSGGPPGAECSAGMAVYRFHTLVVSLNIDDTPLGYRPPYGPPVYFTATYNQREAKQPANFSYSNLGKKWTHNWLSYIEDNPANANSASLATGGGGTQSFIGYNSTTQTFAPQVASQSVLRRVSSSPIIYELKYPNGSIDRFADSDGSSVHPRKVFLTQRRDPYGNAVTLAYDGLMRLARITDAIGQSTSFGYEASDSYLITKVTDPFGRCATFNYNASGRLVSIQDVLGLQSEFNYAGTSDFIQKLTTPYGTTSFTTSESGRTRRLTATDPLMQTEVLEFNEREDLQPTSEPTELLPSGMFVRNKILYARNSYFWDKKAWAEAPENYKSARLYHWLHTPNYSQATSPLESVKLPFENRVWYNYPGQPQNDEGATLVGNLERPSKIGRRLADGSTELLQYEYNDLGKVTSATDSLGRKMIFSYAPNQQDLLGVSVQGGGTLSSFTYNGQHLPLTATDAAGQTTTFTYNSQGQVTSVTNPKAETTTYSYFSTNGVGRQRQGRLSSINGPLAGNADTATFDYDALGRVSQSTTPDGYTVSYEYDVFDRITRVTFPDGTTEEASYDRLHLSSQKDRLGRVTSILYNSLRQLVSITDPAGRQVKYEWCRCGDLKSLIDAMGRVTFWKHDIQGRVSYKQYPDGSKEIYRYDPSNSRLISVTDAKGQVKKLAYNLDGTLASVSYQNAQNPTPNVSYVYDPIYGRLTSMTDGVGTTTYAYHSTTPATSGAGRLSSVDGPWGNDTIAYTYDQLGRIVQRSIGGVPESFAFDAAGRPTGVTNQLGSFAIGYDGVTSRVLSLTHSGGQKTEYSYLPAAQDFRLQRIRHLKPDGTTPLSVFDYTYDAVGRILTWRQQVGAVTAQARTWAFGYDQADQLTSAVATQGGATVQSYGWSYDSAGNRLTQTVDGATATSSYSALNELVFTTATLPAQTYEWDAEDRLLAINQGTARTEFTYDGLGRRVRLVEKQNGSVVSTQSYLWEGLSIRELRDASGGTVQQRYFGGGYVDLTVGSPQTYLQTIDHLGSIRETTDTAGNLVQRVSYDLWGNPSFATGAAASPLAFTGHFRHAGSGLHLAPYRAYAAATGRWISRDPIGEAGGINLYGYVRNIPNIFSDQFGLNPDDPTRLERLINHMKLYFGGGNCRLESGCKGRVYDKIGSKNCRGWPEEDPGAIHNSGDCPNGFRKQNVYMTHPEGQHPHAPGFDYSVENEDKSWTYEGHIEGGRPTPDLTTEPGYLPPSRGVDRFFHFCIPNK
jgi:RHS repeat-associated protein